MKNKGFMLYLLFWTAWSFCWNLPGPFYNKYALGPLGINLIWVTLCRAGRILRGRRSARAVVGPPA